MCKLFPFSFRVKWNGDFLLIIKHYCRGIKVGECSREMINHAIECCEELYLDQLESIRLMGMETSTRCKLNEREYITWEEREELGRYVFSSTDLDELCSRYREIVDLDVSKEIEYIKNNIKEHDYNKTKFKEREIIRFLGELNRREIFRKLSFKEELCRLILIGKKLSRYEDIFEGEGIIDLELSIESSSFL